MKKITFPIRLNMQRNSVQDLHTALEFLKMPVAEKDMAEGRFGKATRKVLEELQATNRLPVTGEVDKATAHLLNQKLKEANVLDSPKEKYRVRGSVRNDVEQGIAGAIVRVFEKTLRTETLLGESKTQANGFYDVQYDPPSGKKQIKPSFHLVVKVFDRQNNLLFASNTITRPGKIAWANFIDGDTSFKGTSLYADIVKKLSPLLDGLSWSELIENDEHQDIAFLAREGGISSEVVMRIALAHRLANATSIAPEIFFAILYQNLPTNLPGDLVESSRNFEHIDRLVENTLDGIASMEPALLEDTLKQGLEANDIPQTFRKRLDMILEQLKSLRLQRTLEQPYLVGKASIRSLLDITELDTAKYDQFVDLYLEFGDTTEDFWQAAIDRGTLDEPTKQDVELTLEVGQIAKNHLPFVRHMKTNTGQNSRFQAVREWAKLDLEEWKEQIHAAGGGNESPIPDNLDGDTEEEQLEIYATILMDRIEHAYPTTAFATRINREADVPLNHGPEIVQFVDKQPELDLRTVHLDQYVQEKGVEILDVFSDADAALGELKLMQRTLNLAPNQVTATELLKNDLHSSSQIYFMGKQRFVEKTVDDGSLSPIEAKVTYDKAAQNYAMVLAKLGEYNIAFNHVTPTAIQSLTLTEEEKEKFQSFPNLESLFGSLDYCDCEHCNSVYSPAAYLVDLLRWLNEKDALPAGQSAKDILLQRRADLGTIKLNCENTNTPLPYIDLVCEILEEAIVPTGIARQTTLSAEELLAAPEHLNQAVYTGTLKNAQFPVGLPFDLWREEAEIYLQHLGIRRAELMKTFQNRAVAPSMPNDAQIAAEFFGIPATEQSLIATADTGNQSVFWDTANPAVDLAQVRLFLEKSTLTYRELLDLLDVRFVNSGVNRIVIDRPTDDCDIDQQTLTNLTIQRLDRAHRFIRLWRRTSDLWSMWELDLLLRNPAVGNGQLDNPALAALYRFRRLQERLNLTTESLLSFYANINREDRTTPDSKEEALYQQIFLNRTVQNPLNPVFEISHVTDANTTNVIADHISSVAASLAMTEPDLNVLLALKAQNGTPLIPASRNLQLSFLTILYRYGTLAKALKLSVPDLLQFLSITGRFSADDETFRVQVDPFVGLQETQRLIDDLEVIQSTRISLMELDYLLNFKPDLPAAMSVELIVQRLTSLRQERQKIEDELFDTSDTKEEVIERSLAKQVTLAMPDELARAMQLINGQWPGSDAERNQFIDQHFAFVADPADAKTRLGALMGATEEARETERQERYDYVLSELNTDLSNNRIREQVANWFNIENEQATDILSISVQATTLLQLFQTAKLLERNNSNGEYTHQINETEFGPQFDALELVHKLGLIIQGLNINSSDLKWLLSNPTVANTPDLAQLPVKSNQGSVPVTAWFNLVRLLKFKARFPEPAANSFLEILEAIDQGTTEADSFDAIAALTGWDRNDLDALNAHLQLQYPDDYTDIESYYRLADCFGILKKAGITAENIIAWSAAEVTEADAQAMKEAAKARYENEQWLRIAAPLQDEIREKKRMALVSYLIANPPAALRQWVNDYGKQPMDANDLFAYFLIDVEMSACQLTSRIKQAISSSQLFVQRTLMNLENQEVIAREIDDWEQWRWMKNYRVWEANRKVFLYPENWIEPELRDGKSPFFTELENDLLQKEITHDHVEEAMLKYVEKLDNIAHLKVCGFYHHLEAGTDELHVFARTAANPPVYYHRRFVDGAYWTPWEQVDLDIKGEHLIPVVYNRKLHLFWPVFTEYPAKDQMMPAAEPSSSTRPVPEQPKYWEIQLAWSVLKNGQWTAQKVSERKLIHPWPRPKFAYTFKARPQGFNLAIDAFISSTREFDDMKFWRPDKGNYAVEYMNGLHDSNRFNQRRRPWHSSAFIFNGDVSDVQLYDLNGWYQIVHSKYSEEGRAITELTAQQPRLKMPALLHYKNELLTNDDGNRNALQVLVNNSRRLDNGRLLANANAPFSVVVAHQDPQFNSAQRPFFYQDADRAYFVKPIREYKVGNYFTTEAPSNAGTAQFRIRYTFYPFYHPYTNLFERELNRLGLDGLLNRKIQVEPDGIYPFNHFEFRSTYSPQQLVRASNNREHVDFSFEGAYSLYNWEMFFHAPLMIACRLNQNQRFEEAMQWFHYIFDPTRIGSEPSPQRYWITKPFYHSNRADYRQQRIDNLLELINKRSPIHEKQVDAWRESPFNPHLIARWRPVAYQRTVVMKYIDNLIDWGDYLFRQDSIESINEATQLYILAAEILGPRPEKVPAVSPVGDKTYNELEADLDTFGNALIEIENTLSPPAKLTRAKEATESLPRLDTLFYFCLPHNDLLLKYWDRVEDRLFKIRHCMNIEGIVRQLPLFQPPIDPALLVKAAAAGLDLGSVLNDLNTPLPHYRFQIMMQRATEFCNEVKTLGNALLSALEKRDAEALALLRSSQEVRLLEAVRDVREQQIAEANEQLEGLKQTKIVTETRRDYYRDRDYMNAWEITSVTLSGASALAETGIALGYILAGGLRFIPDFVIGASGFGGSPQATGRTGGDDFSDAAEKAVKTLSAIARAADKFASMASTQGSYQRRAEEWDFQRDLAEKELEQIERQIAAAEIREAIAKHELRNQTIQIDHAKSVDDFMHRKFTNQALYDWMISQLSAVYFQSYQLAYDMAKRAEQCYRHELGIRESSYVKFGYWDSLKKGLLSGEKLGFDLRRLEAAYLEQHRCELEITKHISLEQVAPLSFLQLKEAGTCTVELPELLFDMDYPGHYMRRIKSVRITIPCVIGPYTSINCRLTLTSNSIRTSNVVGSDFERQNDDNRFVDQFASVQSIATSHARNDGGLFELNFRDDRYLPFEYAGVISTWQIEMPQENNQFDFGTISDVILHVDYIARDGGALLQSAAQASVAATLPSAGVQLFDIRREFATEWHRSLNPIGDIDQVLSINIKQEHFPFLARAGQIQVSKIELIGNLADGVNYEVSINPLWAEDNPANLAEDGLFGDAHHMERSAPAGSPWTIGEWNLKIRQTGASDFQSLDINEIKTMFMVLHYAIG
ncbi:peptidoglycan-binding protein [Chloroflexi bacterium TSY]|nr:peptidoglycan-binding protein [Chloroflexi bacterium TSY]